MKYSSNLLLEDLYNQSEQVINKAISEWQQMPNIRLLAQPAPGSWSAIQCLEHLNSYGRYYLPAIEKAIDKASHTKPAILFKSSLLGNYFYKSMLPGSSGKPSNKMKSPKDHVPAVQLDAAKVLAEFISQLELLGRLLTRAGLIDINKARVPISIAKFIKLKLGDTFLFYIAHINRHVLQVERSLHAESFSIPGHNLSSNLC